MFRLNHPTPIMASERGTLPQKTFRTHEPRWSLATRLKCIFSRASRDLSSVGSAAKRFFTHSGPTHFLQLSIGRNVRRWLTPTAIAHRAQGAEVLHTSALSRTAESSHFYPPIGWYMACVFIGFGVLAAGVPVVL
jgi:hypothetical protein